MEQPVPGSGGRHRDTFTYGTRADSGMSSRDALAAGVWDARRIYQQQGLYDSFVRGQLQELIRQNLSGGIRMTSIFNELCGEIRAAMRRGDWHLVDSLLGHAEAPSNPDEVAELVSLLVDDPEHYSELFAIVHLAERALDPEYVAGLLRALPKLVPRAEWWARTLFVRVLNSHSTYRQLLETLSSANSSEQSTVRETVATVAAWRPDQFADRLAAVAKILGEHD